MSKLLFDTNVFIDLVSRERPAHDDAVNLIHMALSQPEHSVCALASSLKDVYYIYHRHYGSEPMARQIVNDLRETLTIVELTLAVLDRARNSDEPDLEDGLIRAAAELADADIIVTRDEKAFVNSPLLALAPADAFVKISNS